MVTTEQLKRVPENAAGDISRLLAQLRGNPKEHTVSASDLEPIVSDKNIVLIVAKDNEKIVGMASLYILNKLGKRTGTVEDVVVDDGYRGQGIGKQLMQHIIDTARAESLVTVSLTSRPARVAGNKLYQKVGFEQKETNVYRMKL